MNTKFNVLLFALLMLVFFRSDGLAQNCQATADLANFGCINANFYRGAQPTEEGFRQLAKRGIRTIISLRSDDKNAQIEESQVRRAGMKYINLPLDNWMGPKDEKIAEILKQIDSPENQPVFVHCKRGADRTGTVVAVYRISHDGWTSKQAQTEAQKYDFGWWQFWMRNYIKDYYKDYQKRKILDLQTINVNN